MASLLWSAILLAGLLATGGSVALRGLAERLVRSIGVSGSCVAPGVVAVFVVGLAVIDGMVALPVAFYRGFVLERRYGLSAEPVGGWAREHAKATLVTFLVGLAGLSLVYVALRLWPQWWWIVAAAGFSALTAALAYLGPVFLLPLFYRVTPLDRDTLRLRLMALARRAGTPVLGVHVWHLSARTRRANAALAGLGRTRRILVSDTLLREHPDDEIEVVLAHELAHFVHRDVWTGLGLEAALAGAGFYAAHRLLLSFSGAIGLSGPSDVAGLPLLLLGAGGFPLLCLPAVNALSRAHELKADRFALDLTGNPLAFVSAMRRLAALNLSEEEPPPLVKWLYCSHPPVKERIGAAHQWAIENALSQHSACPGAANGANGEDDRKPGQGAFGRYDQLTLHMAAAWIGGQVAVEGEHALLVGLELERDRLIRGGPLRDPVGIDGKAVRDVFGLECDLDEISLFHLDAVGRKRVPPRGDRLLHAARRLTLQ